MTSKAVLVVDDAQGIVAALCRLLADDGWTVHDAHDGTEALLTVGRSRPDGGRQGAVALRVMPAG